MDASKAAFPNAGREHCAVGMSACHGSREWWWKVAWSQQLVCVGPAQGLTQHQHIRVDVRGFLAGRSAEDERGATALGMRSSFQLILSQLCTTDSKADAGMGHVCLQAAAL